MNKISASDKRLIETMFDAVQIAKKLTYKRTKTDLSTEKIKPFFVSFEFKLDKTVRLEVSEGAVDTQIINPPIRHDRAELRIGSPMCGGAMNSFGAYVPDDRNRDYLTRTFWRNANEAIYDVTQDFDSKISRASRRLGVKDRNAPFLFFSNLPKEKKVQKFFPDRKIDIDLDYWSEVFKPLSRLFLRKEIVDSNISLDYCFSKRFFVSSEGVQIVDSFPGLRIAVNGSIVGQNNLIFKESEVFHLTHGEKLPTSEELLISTEDLIRSLYEVRNAPFEKPGAYPTIKDSENFGFFWHELFHAAEGHRPEEDEGESDEDDWWAPWKDYLLTFKGKLGVKIAPEFITVYDDPTLEGGYGSIRFDNEGVMAEKVPIVEKGILKNLLHSRDSAGRLSVLLGKKFKSNGHARADFGEDPVPRMTNTVVKSTNEYKFEELREMLKRICVEKGVPYGLLLVKAKSGEMQQGSLLSVPKRIYRIYVNDRKDERVKGVYVDSSPHQLLETLVATSDSHRITRGFCGAESGLIPVSDLSPDALFSSVGFERFPSDVFEKHDPYLSKPPC